MSFDVTAVGQILAVEKWFSGSALTLVIGMSNCCSYCFQSLAAYLLPRIYLKTRSLENPIMLAALYSTVVFGISAIYAIIDLCYSGYLKRVNTDQKKDKEKKKVQGPELYMEKPFSFRHLRYIKTKSWLSFIVATLYIQMYYQFTNTATDLFMIRYGMTYQNAKNTVAILPLSNAILIPIFSAIYQKFGQKPLGLFLSAALAVATFLGMTLLPSQDVGAKIYIVAGFLSLFFSMFNSCVYSTLIICIPKESTGFMIAFLVTLQNVLSTGLPVYYSFFYGPRTIQAYQNTLYALAGFCAVCAAICFIFFVADVKGDKMLTLPENDKRVKKMQQKMSADFLGSVLTRPRTEDGTVGAATTNVWRSIARSYLRQGEDDLGGQTAGKGLMSELGSGKKAKSRLGQPSIGNHETTEGGWSQAARSEFTKTPLQQRLVKAQTPGVTRKAGEGFN